MSREARAARGYNESHYSPCLKCTAKAQHYSGVCPACRKQVGIKNRYASKRATK